MITGDLDKSSHDRVLLLLGSIDGKLDSALDQLGIVRTRVDEHDKRLEKLAVASVRTQVAGVALACIAFGKDNLHSLLALLGGLA